MFFNTFSHVSQIITDFSVECFYFGLVVSVYMFGFRLANNSSFLMDEEQITNLAKLFKVIKAPKTLNDLLFYIYI